MNNEDIQHRLKDENEEVRRAAVQFLAAVSGGEALKLLISAIGDPSWRVRKTAEEILAGLSGEKELVPSLIAALRSEDNAGLRNSAVLVLTRLGRDAVPHLAEVLNDPDRDMRKFAADILGEIGDRSQIAALLKLLRDKDDNVRSAAAEAIGKIGDEEVVRELIDILKEDDLWLRFAVLEALGRIGKGVPVEPIARLLSDPLLRKAAFDALGMSGKPEAMQYLIGGLNDKSRSAREAAVVNFYRIYKVLSPGEKEKIAADVKRGADPAPLAEFTASSSLDIKKSAALLLGMLGGGSDPSKLLELTLDERLQDEILNAFILMGDEGIEILIRSFPASDNRLKPNICKMLGVIGDRKGTPTLIKALSDEYGHTRQAAAIALGKLTAVEALPALITLLVDEYEDVEEASVRAIIKIGEDHPSELITHLKEAISSRDPRLRRNITTILGRIGNRDAFNVIIHAIKDEDREVRKAAASAFGNLGVEEGIAQLALAYADEDSQVRLAVTNALGAFRSEEVERLLTVAAADDDLWVRCAALRGLAKMSSDYASEFIGSSIFENTGVVAITAIDSLVKIKGKKAEPLLREALNHRDPDVMKAAETALSKLE